MKKFFAIFKWGGFALSFVLMVMYMIAALRVWRVFQELEFMKNFTSSFDWDRNDDYFDALSSSSASDVNEFHLQNFSKNIVFTIQPENLDCVRSSIQSRLLVDDADSSSSPTVFVIVKSRPYESFQRNAIRSTYGGHFKRKLIFVVGRSESKDDEEALRLEASVNKDILQADFLDTYYNLSFKSLSILHWINGHCPYENFYVQADSDALLFPENLHLFAEKNKLKKRHIFGLCWHQAPVRRYGKWRVPETRYSFNFFPDYCSGAAFVMTGDVPKLLIDNLDRSSSYMSVDDAYFSGVLAEKSNVNRVRFSGFVFREELTGDTGKCPCQKLLAVFEYKTAVEIYKAWSKFRIAQSQCL